MFILSCVLPGDQFLGTVLKHAGDDGDTVKLPLLALQVRWHLILILSFPSLKANVYE